MSGSSSELDAARRHRGRDQASQADGRPPNDQTLVLDVPEDPKVPGTTGNDPPPHPTLLLEDAPSSHDAVSDNAETEPAETLAPTSEHEGASTERNRGGQAHALLEQAIAAAQSGNKMLARLHLEQAVEANPDHPVGWLWLAWVADSPAAAISALEQARLNFPHPSLLEHGLAWARGMQAFKLDLSNFEQRSEDCDSQVSTTKCLSSDPPNGARAADEPAGTASVKHATQLLEMVEESAPASCSHQPTHGTQPVAECMREERGRGQTLPLEHEAPLEAVEKMGGTVPAQSDESSGHDSSPDANHQMSGESSVHEVGATLAFGGSELAEFLSRMNPATGPSGPSAGHSQASEDQPGDGVADKPTSDDHPSMEDVSSSSMDLAPPCDQPMILAIDDSPTVRSLVSITLQKCGYQVVTATDGVDALDRMKSCKPALILMDVNMPRLNGYQLCKLVKKHKELRKIPVIMLSGKDGVFDKLRGNMCGCDDYITKPFESADLVRKVSAFLTGVEAHA